MKKKTTYKAFDATQYLDNDAVIVEYLSAAAEDPNPDVFVAALGDVAKARGMAQIAKESGLGRESLYKALSAGAHPRYETVSAVLRGKFVLTESQQGEMVVMHPGEERLALLRNRRRGEDPCYGCLIGAIQVTNC